MDFWGAFSIIGESWNYVGLKNFRNSYCFLISRNSDIYHPNCIDSWLLKHENNLCWFLYSLSMTFSHQRTKSSTLGMVRPLFSEYVAHEEACSLVASVQNQDYLTFSCFQLSFPTLLTPHLYPINIPRPSPLRRQI